jgi:hypothetical protein
LLNKEFLRCVELVVKYELSTQDLKFRLLTARALLSSNNIKDCIGLLESTQDDSSLLLQQSTLTVPGLTTGNDLSHMQATKYLLLAQAYESIEDKQKVVFSLKQALKFDCMCFSAFDKLINNFLINQEEKEALVGTMTFRPESIWLKDYYISRVALEVKEGINEGIVRIKVNDTNSSHLYIASDQDDSGLTPPRFHADMDEDMHGELRNPR